MNLRVWLQTAMAVGVSAAVPARVAAASQAGGSVPVLNLDRGSFRAFMTWRTPTLVGADGRLEPMREPRRPDLPDEDRRQVPVRESAGPAKDWTSPDFDDSEWCRMRGPAAVQRAGEEWRQVYLRGVFVVTDLARVGHLTLSVRYYGGVRVVVNGQELIRAHLPAGEITPDTFGDPYPPEAYIRPDGALYGPRDAQNKVLAERLKVRIRALTVEGADRVAIPKTMLKTGLNVLAIESLSAPVSELAFDAPPAASRGRDVWPHAGVVAARLESSAGAGLIPNTGPTPAIQVGNVSPTETLRVCDYAPPGVALRPVRLVGARNGVFSGRVMLSSGGTIRGLKASASDLVQRGDQGRIPASTVMVRRAEPAAPEESWGLTDRFDRLLSEPPPEVVPRGIETRGAPGGLVPAAVVPVWITVRVPADAAAGDYRASVTIEADEAPRFTVPVELRVHGWKVPDPQDFTVINNICQSPDSVAQYYKVLPWSRAHFERVGRSLDVLRQVGSRICVLNLVVGAHGYGNRESMVRWVQRDDGGYDYDFSIVDQYMNVFAKTCGQPLMVQVTAWMFPGDNPAKPKWPPAGVTVLDKDGRRLPDLAQPPYGTPENEAFWRPVFTELRKRLDERGWLDRTRIGWLTYSTGPGTDVVDVVKKIWPDARWIKNAHSPDKSFLGMPVTCCGWVWGAGALYDPDCFVPWGRRPEYSLAGRKAYPQPWAPGQGYISLGIPRVGVAFVRPGLYDHSPLMRFRMISEAALQGNLRGLGMVGGDFWPLPLGPRGRPATVCTSHGGVTSVNNTLAISSPGPDGAIFNERLEMFREGIQVAEAMIFLQRAVAAASVSEALAGRIQVLLDDRARCLLRNNNPLLVGPSNDHSDWMTGECTDWRARDEDLFALAAEASAAPR